MPHLVFTYCHSPAIQQALHWRQEHQQVPGEQAGQPRQGPGEGDFWIHVHLSIVQDDGPHQSLVNELEVDVGNTTLEEVLEVSKPHPNRAEQRVLGQEFILQGPSPDPRTQYKLQGRDGEEKRRVVR